MDHLVDEGFPCVFMGDGAHEVEVDEFSFCRGEESVVEDLFAVGFCVEEFDIADRFTVYRYRAMRIRGM